MNQNNSFLNRLKNWIKANRNSGNTVIRSFVRLIYMLYTVGYTVKGFLVSKSYRSVCLTKLFRRRRIHQTTPATRLNRYPAIFSAAKTYFEKQEDIRILSFGCSTGEEVLTLRYYFPNAVIVGAEVNKHCLEICEKRKRDDKMIFIDSTDEEITRHGPYDIIFCMAVFQRTPEKITQEGIRDISRLYPFKKFEKQICKLDCCLKEKGLFVVHYSQYDFADTSVFNRYVIYGDYCQDDYRSSVFDKNGCLVSKQKKRNSIFIKLS